MRSILIIMAFLVCSSCQAQDEMYKEASKESKAYHAYRIKLSIPPYGLSKVKSLIAKAKPDDDENLSLSESAYGSLTLREKFTYNMIHAESFSQNCDAMPPIQNENKKISPYLPDAFDEYSWSDRQISFFKENRDSVIEFIKESASRSGRVGVNYKAALVEMNATQMIPFLVGFYKKDKKDLDILTLLMLFMKENNYKPFIQSATFKKLYGEGADYQAFLNFNKANEELIIKRANDYY